MAPGPAPSLTGCFGAGKVLWARVFAIRKPHGRVLQSLGRKAREPSPRHTGKGSESAGLHATGDINGSLIQSASRQRQPRRRGVKELRSVHTVEY